MQRRNTLAKWTGAMAVWAVTATAAVAAEAPQVNVADEIAALKAEVAALRAKDSDSWLNERRKEEVKTLIREVLADADTRASMAAGGPIAGYNKKFFLASEDGNFLLNIGARLQFRYVSNLGNDQGSSAAAQTDENEGGFSMRRTKLEFDGHVLDPKLKYKFVAAFERSGGSFTLEESWLSYDFADRHYVQVGQFKSPFLREEFVSSKRQLAAERTNVNEFFTLDYTQAVSVGGNYDKIRWALSVHDGRESDNVDFNADNTDIAVAGRAEYLLAGGWKQFDDFTAWSSDAVGVLLGAGFDYENGEGGHNTATSAGNGADWEHMLQYTFDASVEVYPFSFMGAFVGRMLEFNPGQGAPLAASDNDAHQWGFILQGSFMVIPDKMDVFARWEYLNFDNVGELTGSGLVSPAAFEHQHIVTVGTNYYFNKHDLKLTLDAQWAPEGIRAAESGAGQVASFDESHFVIRGQIQLAF